MSLLPIPQGSPRPWTKTPGCHCRGDCGFHGVRDPEQIVPIWKLSVDKEHEWQLARVHDLFSDAMSIPNEEKQN